MKHAFILGNPRSGTSLLRLMLNQHPNIVAPPECGFAHWWLHKYRDWNIANVSQDEVETFLNDLFTSKKIGTWKLDRDLLKRRILDLKPDTYSRLVDCVYVSYNKGSSDLYSTIVDKNNYYINHLGDLTAIWPDSVFLFQVRDGRDVACSYLDVNKLETNSPFKPKFPTTIDAIAKEWNENNKRILNFVKDMGHDRFMIVRYEDLITNTKPSLEKICSFLQLPYNEEMLAYHLEKENDLLKEPTETLDWKKKTLEEPDARQIARYKGVLSSNDIAIFLEHANEMLNYFGYE